MVELEMGSTDTKLWKDVKRKRVRLPDLVCLNCGIRVESRAKREAKLTMSHSPTETERSWDFGMVNTDIVAYPVCESLDETYWSAGKLSRDISYWHERNWIKWLSHAKVNYFEVEAFRAVPFNTLPRKGATEGSELAIGWPATFASFAGTVIVANAEHIKVLRDDNGKKSHRKIKADQRLAVSVGDHIEKNQIIASTVIPLHTGQLNCPELLSDNYIGDLLASRERTLRFTGVKLARLRNERSFEDTVRAIVADPDEDLYVRLEGVAYLASVCANDLVALINPYLTSSDPQIQLEAVITLSETATLQAAALLSGVLDNQTNPYFLRSAAAWGLSRIKDESSRVRLVRAFGDVNLDIRQEALDGIVGIGGLAIPLLVATLREAGQSDVMAGCAEALRQQADSPDLPVEDIVSLLTEAQTSWPTWLVGHLPSERVAASIASLQDSRPELHYAITLLWSFVESWIARRWELSPDATYPVRKLNVDQTI